MNRISSILNTREIAILIWTCVLLVWAVSKQPIRESLKDVARSFFNPHIISVVLFMTAYVTALVYLLYLLGIWQALDLKDTVLWLVSIAFVMLFQLSNIKDYAGFFRKSVLDGLKVTVMLEFITNLYTFRLWIEMILVPLIAIAATTWAVAERKPEYNSVAKLMKASLVCYGFAVLGFTVFEIIHDPNGFATLGNLLDYLLPIVLTLAYLPFAYLFALFMLYNQVFVRLAIFTGDKELIAFAKKKLIMRFHLNLLGLVRWSRLAGPIRLTNRNDVYELLNG